MKIYFYLFGDQLCGIVIANKKGPFATSLQCSRWDGVDAPKGRNDNSIFFVPSGHNLNTNSEQIADLTDLNFTMVALGNIGEQ